MFTDFEFSTLSFLRVVSLKHGVPEGQSPIESNLEILCRPISLLKANGQLPGAPGTCKEEVRD
jgi:hypothetical protein